MPVQQSVQLEVVVVLTKGVDQRLGNLEPADEEGELQGEEEGIPEVQLGSLVTQAGLVEVPVGLAGLGHHPLGAKEGGGEVGVDRQGDQLGVDQRHTHPVVAEDPCQPLPDLGNTR